ncbi:cation transporter [Pararhizobium mangrovi]|uniref:Cation transporter n=2 Tax=Pararhizobium mangrovi TaxID=2590452 RepID=A0A506UAC0_9HYPH|nr:cation transporter [Pararhizobium mangrovi]
MVERLALYSIPIALVVLALKVLAWRLTGSVALFSDALETIVNVVAATAAYAAVRYSRKPADAGHHFGHYKAEYVSAVLEGVLIVVAALLIAREALADITSPAMPGTPWLGLAINAFGGIINAVWAMTLIRLGTKHNSPAVVADGRHLYTDVLTSIGVIVGLALAVTTGWAVLDPLLALIVAVNIVWEGWRVISSSLNGLMDQAMDPGDIDELKTIIADHAEGSLGVHDLKTRVAGPATFIDFHMVAPRHMSVAEAHAICDRLENAIKAFVPGASIAIHIEPRGEAEHGIRVRL